eukprot:SAG22_NODE_442_length_10476_cov_4.827792_4_plen_79_part_00
MPKKGKKTTKAPTNYYDMAGSVEKDKKVKQSDVFGKKSSAKAKPKAKSKKVKKGYHRMPDGTIMKDSDMKKDKKKKKY